MKNTKEPAPETGLSLRVLWDGVLAGWLGGGVVALWFLIFDTARGHPFETPALLSAVLLHGAHNPHITITQGLVFEYTLIHFAAFSIVGVAMAYLMEMAEREPALWISVVIFAFAFEVFFLGFVMFVGPVLMVEISWWSILIGNLLATAAIFTFVLTRHPSIGRGWLKPWLGVLREGVAAGIVGGVVVALWFLVYDLAIHRGLGARADNSARCSDAVRLLRGDVFRNRHGG